MDLLEKLAMDYEIKTNQVKKILNDNYGKTMQWIKNERTFYILSISAKKSGYQLTYFLDDEPVSDRIRESFTDNDFIEELALSESYLNKII